MNKYLKKAENGSGIDHYVRVPGTGAKQKITFTKMHGCANDYVYIDCFQNDIQNYAELAIYLSDRHTGIGGEVGRPHLQVDSGEKQQSHRA